MIVSSPQIAWVRQRVLIGTRDGVAAADAGKHFPKRVKDAIDCIRGRRSVIVRDVIGEHRAFSGGVFAIGFDVNGKILIIARLGHRVIFDQAFDLRFGDGGNLAFVGVERREAFGGAAFGANGPERIDQVGSLIPLFGRLDLLLRNTEAFGELEPQLGMIRRAGFFVDKITEQLFAGRLIVAARVHGGEVRREGGDVVVILAGVIGQGRDAQLTAGPGEVERMGQKMFGSDLAINGVEVWIHIGSV